MRKSLIAVVTAAIAGAVIQAHAASEPTVVSPEALQWKPSTSLPGAEIAVISGNPEKKGPFIARVKLPADFQIPAHSHNINEYDTVLSGKLYLGLGEKADNHNVEVPAGSFVTIPAKYLHYAWTKEETILQINGQGPWGMIYKKDKTAA